MTDARIDNGGQPEVTGTAVDTDLVRGSAHVRAGGVQNGVDFDGTTLTLATASGTIAWQFSGLSSDAEFNVTSDTAIVPLTQYAASFAPAGFADTTMAPLQESHAMLPTLANAA